MVVEDKDQMTSIERWDYATNFKEPDRVPVAPLNLYLSPYYSKPQLTTHQFLLDFPKAFEAFFVENFFWYYDFLIYLRMYFKK